MHTTKFALDAGFDLYIFQMSDQIQSVGIPNSDLCLNSRSNGKFLQKAEETLKRRRRENISFQKLWRNLDTTLTKIITEFVYKLLEDKHNLQKVTIPVDAEPDEPTSFFYMSEDALNKDKLLILIHGNGVVRAEQWARRLSVCDVDSYFRNTNRLCWIGVHELYTLCFCAGLSTDHNQMW
ncbi:uncharacterized protein LOC133182722 [Saccostrea echinata]|uniref:uncharacterized protein LOC133182722 n=1 Tax=Saccostrea echinata TaxID=191078 RepID=UPI002A82AE75|nr:uncharacterized protein LOC133182722 [Saccostrea echinata]